MTREASGSRSLLRIISCPAPARSWRSTSSTENARSPPNPLGLKGAGEAGVDGVGAAIAAAIDDAIGIPGAVARLPVTPQRLKEILSAARG